MFIHEQLVLKRINDVQAVLGRPSVEDEALSYSDCSTFLHYLFPGRTCQRKASPPPQTHKSPATEPQFIWHGSAGLLNDERPSDDDLSKENLGIGLLSHTKVCSIMGDEELDCRVRNGIGYTLFSMDTKEISKNI